MRRYWFEICATWIGSENQTGKAVTQGLTAQGWLEQRRRQPRTQVDCQVMRVGQGNISIRRIRAAKRKTNGRLCAREERKNRA